MVEPMGMETMVYFIVNGVEICGRVNPAAARNAGEIMPLVADMNHMHLIDPRHRPGRAVNAASTDPSGSH